MPRISEERRDARRRQILNAAVACFARKGFDATRVEDICRQAGISPGGVYLYFESKDAIVRALAARAEVAAAARWDKMTQAGGDSGSSRIEKLFDLVCSDPDATSARMGVQFWAQAFDNAFLSNTMRVDHGESVKRIARLLRSEGDLAPADAKALAEMVVATLRGFSLQRAIVPTIDLKPAARAFLRALRGELARAIPAREPSKESSRKNTKAEVRRSKRGKGGRKS